jgi:hypothetical protein
VTNNEVTCAARYVLNQIKSDNVLLQMSPVALLLQAFDENEREALFSNEVSPVSPDLLVFVGAAKCTFVGNCTEGIESAKNDLQSCQF